MRTLTTVLAFFGGIWAIVGIGGFAVTVASIQYVENVVDVAELLVTLILMLSGYFIWWGWVRYSIKERYPLVGPRTFWIVSLVHHLVCVLYLLPMDVWGGGDDPWWIPAWIIGNAVIAAVVLMLRPTNNSTAGDGDAPQRTC
ncbi:hypothetical protein [Haloferula sp. A504]|uniref:hypothetical protein n=1 Tax=Haloferula sp. A504 TaxID=3373601 RepID=UPI0031CAA966|nr:hypothetical protein [Verrucomicrobiaceae bacterium E54]